MILMNNMVYVLWCEYVKTNWVAQKQDVDQLLIMLWFFFFYESLCQIKQGIQDSIANVQYPNYKDINTQNEKEANIKVKLMKVWI